MIIYIDSSFVDAHRMKIFANDKLVFNECMSSKPKGMICLNNIESTQLRFEYSFLLTEDEEKELMHREDIGYNEISCYAFNHQHEEEYEKYKDVRDFLVTDAYCPKVAMGLYESIVDCIPADVTELHLTFKRSLLNPSIAVLEMADNNDQTDIKLFYRRVESWRQILEAAKTKNRKDFLFKFLIPVLVFFPLAIWVVEHYPEKRALYGLFRLILVFVIFVHIETSGKRRKVLKKAGNLHSFKVENGSIVEL